MRSYHFSLDVAVPDDYDEPILYAKAKAFADGLSNGLDVRERRTAPCADGVATRGGER